MRYSDEIREELLARNNIVDIVGEQVTLKRRGVNYFGLCPFHGEKTPSFSVSESKQIYYCFGCHAGGNVITFLMEYHKMSYVEALQDLAGRAGMVLPEEELTPEERRTSEKRKSLLEIHKKAAAYYYYRLKGREGEESPGLRYLKDRGLSSETIRHFGLGYAGQYRDSLYRYLRKEGYGDEILKESGLFYFDEKRGAADRFWNRVMYPIFNERGRVIGFGGRVLGKGEPKYLNSPESFLFNKRKNLYALNYAKSSRRPYLILCEGYMDVISMHQAGFTNACASLGTALTEEQAVLLRRHTEEVILIYDSDQPGRQAALRAIPILKAAGMGVKIADMSPFKDPDELIQSEGTEGMEERLRKAENSLIFELEQEAAQVRRDDPEGWTHFQRDCARRLVSFPDELERENYLEAICARFSIPKEGMRSLVRTVAREGSPAASYVPLKSGKGREKKEDPVRRIEGRMIAYLAQEPNAYRETRELITAEDFRDPLCRQLAEALYAQIEAGRVQESLLLAAFPESEEQTAAAVILESVDIPVSPEEKDRAFTDAVIRMLDLSAREELLRGTNGDPMRYNRFISRKRLIEEFRRGKLLHISE